MEGKKYMSDVAYKKLVKKIGDITVKLDRKEISTYKELYEEIEHANFNQKEINMMIGKQIIDFVTICHLQKQMGNQSSYTMPLNNELRGYE